MALAATMLQLVTAARATDARSLVYNSLLGLQMILRALHACPEQKQACKADHRNFVNLHGL